MPSIRNVTNALKQAAKAFGPGKFEIGGKEIICPHCGNDTFAKGEGQLNTSLMTFFQLDWLDETATVMVCAQCSQIQWFGKMPTRKP